MTDYSGVEACIKKYEKSEETIKKAGLKRQAPAAEVMKVLFEVAVRITNVSTLNLFVRNGVLYI